MPFDAPPVLWTRVCARRCVAFVGAGFSVPAGYPTWRALIERLIESCEFAATDERKLQLAPARAHLANGSLALAVHTLRLVYQDNSAPLRDELRSIFATKPEAAWTDPARMGARLDHIASAPWAGIVTTNYDELIEPIIKVRRPSWIEVHGASSVALGSALHKGVPFFVKLHGSGWDTDIVLSADDYHRNYLADSLLQSFLNALMLNYHLVFLGSSVEDEILRIRIRLNYQFHRQIPVAYALFRDCKTNRDRDHLLRHEANIEPIYYPDCDSTHSAMDEFLRVASDCADPSPDMFEASAKRATRSQIGKTNAKLLELVQAAPNKYLSISAFQNTSTLFGAYSGAERFLPYLGHFSAFEIRARLEYLASSGYLHIENSNGASAVVRVAV